MSTNKDLLKQAIAEAKTIREAAIANAKEALEETLTPHLKEMLAMKLQEMEEDDDMNEEDMINDPEGLEAHGNINEEEEEAETEEEETEEDETEEGEEEDVDVKDMSVEELKDLIRDIVSQEVGHDESEEEAPEGAEDMTGMDSEEEIDINELLAELAEMDGEVEEGKLGDFVKKVGDKVKATVGTGGKMDQFIDRTHAKMKKAGVASPYGGQKVFEESEELDEYGSSTMREPSDAAAAGLDNIISGLKKLVAKSGPIAAKAKAALEVLGSAAGAAMRAEATELNEALATVRQLRNQLQEVNLLNAKLLYVNKVFKSNNLSEGQKVNVVAAFDKAETVKEVKLVFETVSKNVTTKQPVKQSIREHKSFASKATGSTQKQVINEVSEAVHRMQVLAGIKQREI